MNAARLAARALALLGPSPGPLHVEGSHAPRFAAALGGRAAVAERGNAPGAAIVIFLGARAQPAERQALLSRLHAQLPSGGPLVLIDHNQPRARWRRLIALGPLFAAGFGPARARYPAARELAVLGFVVERLRLARGERVQLVAARRR